MGDTVHGLGLSWSMLPKSLVITVLTHILLPLYDVKLNLSIVSITVQ